MSSRHHYLSRAALSSVNSILFIGFGSGVDVDDVVPLLVVVIARVVDILLLCRCRSNLKHQQLSP